MKSISLDLIQEIESRSEGALQDIALEILSHIGEDFSSDEAIRTSIKRRVDAIVREEN